MKDALEWAKGQLISIIITACLTLGTNGLYRKMTGSFIEGWTFALLPIFVLLLSEVFISLLQIKPHRYKSYIEELSIFFEYCGEDIFVTKKYRVRALRRNLNKMYHRITWFSDEKLEIKVLTEGFFVETIPNNDIVREFYIVFPRTLKLFETIDFEFKIRGENKGRKFKNYYWYDVIVPTGKLKIDVNVASKYRENRLVLKEFRENMDGNTLREKEVETLGNYTWFVKRPKLNYSYIVSWKWKILSWSNSMKETEQTGYPSIDKPWLKYYSEEAINAKIPEKSVYEVLKEANRDNLSATAIIYYGRKITFGELFENIDKTAKALLTMGVKEKEIVTVALPSIPEALYLVYALNKIGAVANVIHPLPSKNEMVFYLNEVKSRYAFIFDGAVDLLQDDLTRTAVEKCIVVSPSCSLPLVMRFFYHLKNRIDIHNEKMKSWDWFISKGTDTELPLIKKDPFEVTVISHTGGTTGDPKGCMLSDYNINSVMTMVGSILNHEDGECALAVLPPFVMYSLVNSMMQILQLRMAIVLIPAYKAEDFWKYIKQYHPNHVSSIPAYWEAILGDDKKRDWSCLKNVYYGGEGMSADTEKAVNELLLTNGCKSVLHKGIGSTEMVSAATMSYDGCNPLGSVGVPLTKVNCKIVSPDSTSELGFNERGEICFTGPNLMLGYYNNPDATAEVIRKHEDGLTWLHTGDVGYMDEDGVLFVTGRIKRIIMTKGEDGQVTKMFPDRIEKAINKHPSVFLSCVVGIKDADRIHYPKAFVELKPECEATEELKTDIIQQCKEELPDYMVPVEIEYIPEMPRTSRGKVDYRALEEL